MTDQTQATCQSAARAIRAAYEEVGAITANRLADDAAAKYPDSAEIHALRATILLWRGQHDEAEEALRKATELGPDLAVTWAARADVESVLGDAADAEAAANRAIELDDTDPWVLTRCGSAYNVANSPATITVARRLVELRPDSDSAVAYLISVLNVRGEGDEAREMLAEAEARFPDSPAIWNRRAGALFNEGRANDAAGLLARVVEKMPEDSGSWSDLAMMYYQAGRLNESESAAKRALEISKRTDGALLAMAAVCSMRGQHWQAAEWRNKTVRAITSSGSMSGLSAAMLELRKGDYQAAIDAVDAELPTMPPTIKDGALEVKAKALLCLGRLDEAMAVAEQVRGQGSFPGSQYILKGQILCALKDYEKAVAVLREGMERFSDVGDVRAALLRAVHSSGNAADVRALIDDTLAHPPQMSAGYLPIIQALKETGYKQEARNMFLEGARVHSHYTSRFAHAAAVSPIDYWQNRAIALFDKILGKKV